MEGAVFRVIQGTIDILAVISFIEHKPLVCTTVTPALAPVLACKLQQLRTNAHALLVTSDNFSDITSLECTSPLQLQQVAWRSALLLPCMPGRAGCTLYPAAGSWLLTWAPLSPAWLQPVSGPQRPAAWDSLTLHLLSGSSPWSGYHMTLACVYLCSGPFGSITAGQ